MMNNLYIPAHRNVETEFEEQNTLLRHKEQRIYTDDELLRLPEVGRDHPHFDEWLLRKRSCRNLIRHLETKKQILNILDLKCGNGWLCHELSRIPGSRVIGMDTALSELLQAARVFSSNSKLKFICGDIFDGLLNDLKFDVIVMAACIQHFPDLGKVIGLALPLLFPEGELHILDSAFYRPGEMAVARRRMVAYYEQLGMPEMAGRYYHHSITEISPYHHRMMSNPNSIRNKLGRNPFPWICIRNQPFD